jgi:hypothetical protein
MSPPVASQLLDISLRLTLELSSARFQRKSRPKLPMVLQRHMASVRFQRRSRPRLPMVSPRHMESVRFQRRSRPRLPMVSPRHMASARFRRKSRPRLQIVSRRNIDVRIIKELGCLQWRVVKLCLWHFRYFSFAFPRSLLA